MNIFAVYLVEEGALKLEKVGAVYLSEEGSLSSEGMCFCPLWRKVLFN